MLSLLPARPAFSCAMSRAVDAAAPVGRPDVLQVMDLVVNGPLKAHMRRHRCYDLFSYFQHWKLKVFEARERSDKVLPNFCPHKPVLMDGLNMLQSVCRNEFTTKQFREGIKRTFVKVGLAPFNDRGDYVNYTGPMPAPRTDGNGAPCDDGLMQTLARPAAAIDFRHLPVG